MASIPGMQNFNHFDTREPVVSNFVVVSPLGTRFTGRWPTRADAFDFSASLKGGHWPEIEARIQPCAPYMA